MDGRIRVAAAVLSLGALFWGTIIGGWLIQWRAGIRDTLIWLPGYAVMIGYLVRTVTRPRLSIRLLIWGASALVQGMWLLLVGMSDVSILSLWWLGAFVASLWALHAEVRSENLHAG